MMSVSDFFNGKKILVTGGAGSIGSVIVKHLLRLNPKVVRILDNNEYGLYKMKNEVSSPNVRFLLGDVRDKERVERAVEGIDIVFHAAALKHVPLCEYNPFEALKTNAIGTQNIIDSALGADVEKVINISTDKAVHPTNVMGATKLVSERLISSANYYKGKRRTTLSSVRFGNVLDSSGSVIPLFKNQIKKGGPLTLTDTKMTRFMMSKDQAVDLILKAALNCMGGEIFILKMGSIRIVDLAEATIDVFAPRYGFRSGDIKTGVNGIREGEKIHEELMTEDESKRALETDEMFIILPESKELLTRINYNYEGSSKAIIGKYTSGDVKCLTKDEIKKFL